MFKQENLPQNLALSQEMAGQLIDMFSMQHPAIFRMHLENMFLAWNLTEDANEPDFRESYQMSYKMLMDFFFIFSSREADELRELKDLRNSKDYFHEAVS